MSAQSALPIIPFAEAIAHRHSVYALTSTLPPTLTPAKIRAILATTLAQVPSAFNSQSTRCVLLLGAEHKKLWRIAADTVLPKTAEAARGHIEPRIAGFAAAAGTVLFCEDEAVLAASRARNPPIAHMFSEWSEHSSGMHQFVAWTALEAEPGVGCNLQHYQYDDEMEGRIREAWSLPETWKMKSQLVFGGLAEGASWPEAKAKLPTNETLKVFGEE